MRVEDARVLRALCLDDAPQLALAKTELTFERHERSTARIHARNLSIPMGSLDRFHSLPTC
jgi:hypothetical protein